MMVRVMYYDGLTEMVRPPVLQHLIETRKIHKFRRSDGWAVLGIDALRNKGRQNFYGDERRERSVTQ